MANRRLSVSDRFATKYVIDPESGCWLWTDACNPGGYGNFSPNHKTVSAHRWSYEHHVGPIPDGLGLDHVCHTNDLSCPGGKCKHRRCVNPARLEPVTAGQNQARSQHTITGKNIAKAECANGHPYDAVSPETGHHVQRYCKTCKREATARWRAANRVRANELAREAARRRKAS